MNRIFKIQKVNVINDALEFTTIKTRILLFNKLIFSYSTKPKSAFKHTLKHI